MRIVGKIARGAVDLCVGLPILLFYVAGVKTIEWWERIHIRAVYKQTYKE
jgi:hypothetical protein